MKRLFLIVCLMLIPSIVMAASSRVLPDSYTEYTYDSAGGGEDYTALATWEADTDVNCTSTGQVLTCSSGIHADYVDLSGATTDSNGFRVIRASSGARGTKTSGVRFVVSSTSVLNGLINFSEAYSSAYDVAAKAVTTATSANAYAFGFRCASTGYNKIIGCTAYECTSESVYEGHAAGIVLFNASNYVVANCFVTGCKSGYGTAYGAGIRCSNSSGSKVQYLYNNTVTGNEGYDIRLTPLSGGLIRVYAKNNIFGTASGPTFSQTTNATSGVTLESDGYHLSSSDTGAMDDGTDLSSDGVFIFTDDIDGDTRSGSWDIGCDEYISTARRRIFMVQ